MSIEEMQKMGAQKAMEGMTPGGSESSKKTDGAQTN